MDNKTHLNTDDLILFMDRELDPAQTAQAEKHLLLCAECGTRLQALQKGSAAHHRYHEQILKPTLQVPETTWPRLKPKPRHNWTLWWAAAALAATLAVVWTYFPLRTEPSAQEVLEKAEAAPESPRGEIVFTTGPYRFARPAVLETATSDARVQHIQALFVQADYSWANPLSARSFAAWRNQHLRDKHDFVTAIHEENGRSFYRIRTRTDSGILHSASLMLEAATYHPTKASFEFQGENLIEVTEQTSPPPSKPQEAQSVAPPKPVETAATPEDELRVFAALDAIGADAEEPIDVTLDPAHHSVLVTGMGMPPDRRKQIEAALASLPNTIVRLSSSPAVHPDKEADSTAASPSGTAFRQKLQDKAGGARQLQTLTDNALDISNALFAQSHALLVLAQQFPPPVESALTPASASTLLALRQRHLGAMSYALRRLQDQLRPLLADDVMITGNQQPAPWQTQAAQLYESARNLDRLLSRLLAGTYDAPAGETMVKELPDDLSKLDSLVLASSK
jgi:hypothetical protein